VNLWSNAYVAVPALNVSWFGMGAWYFTLKSDAATKLLVPKSARVSPLFATLSASVRRVERADVTYLRGGPDAGTGKRGRERWLVLAL
jgi:hypothetical protein